MHSLEKVIGIIFPHNAAERQGTKQKLLICQLVREDHTSVCVTNTLQFSLSELILLLSEFTSQQLFNRIIEWISLESYDWNYFIKLREKIFNFLRG